MSSVRRRVCGVWATVLVTCAAGCSASPDIVATSARSRFNGPDGGITSGPTITECKPGRYEGTMSTLPGDKGGLVGFSGTIKFSLVQVMGGEFPVLASAAHLEGTGKDNSSFSAEIPSGLGCIEGKFNTELVNGTYTVAGGGRLVPFEGPIKGLYNAEFNLFAGNWTSYLHFTPDADPFVVQGTWTALFAGDN